LKISHEKMRFGLLLFLNVSITLSGLAQSPDRVSFQAVGLGHKGTDSRVVDFISFKEVRLQNENKFSTNNSVF